MVVPAWLVFALGISHAEDFVKAQDLYLTKCAKCHKLYEPKDYEDDSWSAWMNKMKKKAHLSEEQYGLILSYTEKLRKGEVS